MKQIDFRVKVEKETDVAITRWADQEGRSKTRHVGVLLRRLATLAETNPAELQKLGLMDRLTVN